MILPDVLKINLDVVFCGSAVGSASALKQAYYAGNGNKFYPILAKTGLTPVLLLPEQYKQVLEFNIGLTDMVKTVSGSDSILKKEDFDIEGFRNKILNYQPGIICGCKLLGYRHAKDNDRVRNALVKRPKLADNVMTCLGEIMTNRLLGLGRNSTRCQQSRAK